jgi:hypothetical protein
MAKELFDIVGIFSGEVSIASVLSLSRSEDQFKLLVSILDKKLDVCQVEEILAKLRKVLEAESDELPSCGPTLTRW